MLFFCSFVKVALTKNPKKRPSAERMLYQPFVLAGDLNVRLSLELLNKVRNPEASASRVSSVSSSTSASGSAASSAASPAGPYAAAPVIADDDDGGIAQNVPMRIRSSRNKDKTQPSELNGKHRKILMIWHA